MSILIEWEHTFVHTQDEVAVVKGLLAVGAGDRVMAEATGIPRRTINGWRRQGFPRCSRVTLPARWRPENEGAYSYLLGAYLGDGHIAMSKGRWPFLRIVLDRAYPAIVEECGRALGAVFPEARVRRYEWEGRGTSILQLSSPLLVMALPQHGRGKKHERPITLEEWQQAITRAHPREVLRGLIHSDGSRVINRFSVKLPSGRVGHYAYPRYFFTNLSSDIRGIFCDHCDLLGVRWTQSSHKNISIAHRDSVAILDSFIGPKR